MEGDPRFNKVFGLIGSIYYNQSVKMAERILHRRESLARLRRPLFWDTESYVFPSFLYSKPDICRKLLEYRYSILPQARNRARNFLILKVRFLHGVPSMVTNVRHFPGGYSAVSY